MIPLGPVATIAAQYKASQYTALAAATVWAYDVLITLDEELALLWSRNGVLIKILYLINRYLCVLGVTLFLYALVPPDKIPKSRHASKYPKTDDLPTDPLTSSADGHFHLILLPKSHKWSSPAVRFQYLASSPSKHHYSYICHAALRRILHESPGQTTLDQLSRTLQHRHGLLLGMFLRDMLRETFWDPWANVCVMPIYNTWPLAGMYLTPMIIDSVIYVATLSHAIQFSRGKVGMKGTATSAVLRTLYVEGSLYYLLIIHMRLGSIIVYYVAPLGMQVLFCYLTYCISSALTARWFLTLRRKITESQQSTHEFDTTLASSSWRPSNRQSPNNHRRPNNINLTIGLSSDGRDGSTEEGAGLEMQSKLTNSRGAPSRQHSAPQNKMWLPLPNVKETSSFSVEAFLSAIGKSSRTSRPNSHVGASGSS